MDAKITKKRLSYLLSYDWIKMVATAVAAIVVWSLIFTTTATRITSSQEFIVCNYLDMQFGEKAKMYSSFSHEVLEAKLSDHMRGGTSTFYELARASVEVGEGDLMMAANYPASRTEKLDENGNVVKDAEGNSVYEYGATYVQEALGDFYGNFTRLDDEGDAKGFFTQMREYLAKFYTVTSQTEQTFGEIPLTVATYDVNTLNETLVKQEFRARIKATKDKRFKKEEQIVAGEQKEVERIQSYLTDGVVTLTYATARVTEEFSYSGVYGINICPNEKAMNGLKDQIYYMDFDGSMTAQDMNVLFLDLKGLDKNYQYENLLYLNALIQDVYKPIA